MMQVPTTYNKHYIMADRLPDERILRNLTKLNTNSALDRKIYIANWRSALGESSTLTMVSNISITSFQLET